MYYFLAGLIISAIHATTIRSTAHGNAVLSSFMAFSSVSMSMLVLVSIVRDVSASSSHYPVFIYALGMALGNFIAVKAPDYIGSLRR